MARKLPFRRMLTRAFALSLLMLAVALGGCGGDDDGGGGGSTGARTDAGSTQQASGDDAVRSCVEKAGYTTSVAGKTNPFSPGAPAPLFEVYTTEARWVVMPAKAEPAMRKELRPDLIAREGDLIVVSETKRPPRKLVECLGA